MSCEAEYGDDEDDCAADSGCVWIEDWDSCYETCDDRDEDDCDWPCEWSGDSCSLSCRAEYGNDEDECAADSECVWIEDCDCCQETCDDRDEDDCQEPCAWSGDSCSLSCEYKYGDDEDDCAADSKCFWIENWHQCKNVCEGRDEDDCHDHCAWSGDYSCELGCEHKYDDEDECVAVCKSNLQIDFNVSVFECFDTSTSAVLRDLDESNRSVQKSAESTSI